MGDFTSSGSGVPVPSACVQYKSPTPVSAEVNATRPSGEMAGEPSIPSPVVRRLNTPRDSSAVQTRAPWTFPNAPDSAASTPLMITTRVPSAESCTLVPRSTLGPNWPRRFPLRSNHTRSALAPLVAPARNAIAPEGEAENQP